MNVSVVFCPMNTLEIGAVSLPLKAISHLGSTESSQVYKNNHVLCKRRGTGNSPTTLSPSCATVASCAGGLYLMKRSKITHPWHSERRETFQESSQG